MTGEDWLRRYQEAGAQLVETARGKAEEILRDLGGLGGSGGAGPAPASEEGRGGIDRLVELVRREVASQLAGLGVATKDDLADLERRLSGAAGAGGAAGRAARAGGGATKKAASSAKRSATQRSATKRSATGTGAAGRPPAGGGS